VTGPRIEEAMHRTLRWIDRCIEGKQRNQSWVCGRFVLISVHSLLYSSILPHLKSEGRSSDRHSKATISEASVQHNRPDGLVCASPKSVLCSSLPTHGAEPLRNHTRRPGSAPEVTAVGYYSFRLRLWITLVGQNLTFSQAHFTGVTNKKPLLVLFQNLLGHTCLGSF
jgi:hypothetical protein